MNIDERIIRSEERAVFSLRSLYARYGYTRFKMSRFEEYDLYVRNKDFLISDEVITFTDHSGRLLAMKPDVTLSIIKNTTDRPGVVQKVYYHENVYRVAKVTHSFKEILQAGLECIGDIGSYEVAEVVLLAAQSLALISENYVLDLSHMGLLSAMLDSSGLSPAGQSAALAFIHQKNAHELSTLCKAENADGSKLNALITCCGDPQTALSSLRTHLSTPQELEALGELARLCDILEHSGCGSHIRVDLSVGNDMKYYSGVVFKGYIQGVPSGVLSGGQYDKLLRKMGRTSGAIGFAVYLDLLERMEQSSADRVDVLLLHDGDADPAALIRAAQQLSSSGTVLVAQCQPEHIIPGKILKFDGKEGISIG